MKRTVSKIYNSNVTNKVVPDATRLLGSGLPSVGGYKICSRLTGSNIYDCFSTITVQAKEEEEKRTPPQTPDSALVNIH